MIISCDAHASGLSFLFDFAFNIKYLWLMGIDEVLTHAREMRFADKSEQDLHQMLIVCGNRTGHYSDTYSTSQIPHAIKMVHEELARRQRAKNHQEAIAEQQRLNQKATEQGDTLHKETMGEVGKLKTAVDLVKNSVDHLARPRWIDWAILIVGAVAAIGVVISLFLIH